MEGRVVLARLFVSRSGSLQNYTKTCLHCRSLAKPCRILGFLFVCIRVIRGPLLFRHSGSVIFSDLLPADQDQNAGCQRQDAGHDRGDTDVKERRDSNKDQIDGEQKHSEIFGDVHEPLLRQLGRVCTLKLGDTTNPHE